MLYRSPLGGFDSRRRTYTSQISRRLRWLFWREKYIRAPAVQNFPAQDSLGGSSRNSPLKHSTLAALLKIFENVQTASSLIFSNIYIFSADFQFLQFKNKLIIFTSASEVEHVTYDLCHNYQSIWLEETYSCIYILSAAAFSGRRAIWL